MPPSYQSSLEGYRGRLIVVSGPGGVGKSTIVDALKKRIPFHFSVSATTRQARPGEVDGVHYRFVTRSEFEDMIAGGELLEWAMFLDNYYGTPVDAVEAVLAEGRDVLLDIEIQGARQVREAVPEAVMIFVAPPSIEDLRRRLEYRADTSPADIEGKVTLAAEQMAAAAGLFDHIVVNDDIDRAVTEIIGLLSRNFDEP